MSATNYSITFINNSAMPGAACLYQQNPNMGYGNIMSLAWFAQYVNPTNSTQFAWDTNFCFVCGETGTLMPGVQFEATQMTPADLVNANSIVLSQQYGAPQFGAPQPGSQPGSLTVICDATISNYSLSVGIGMAEAGTFVCQALPNMSFVFMSQPQYWVTFGQYQQGQVLDTAEISNAVQVTFPPNVYAMTVTLNPDNSYSVEQAV